jgi:hypothetical protein
VIQTLKRRGIFFTVGLALGGPVFRLSPLNAEPAAARVNSPTPSVTKEQFLGFSSVNIPHTPIEYFPYGWAVGAPPPGWGVPHGGFSSAKGNQGLRDWLNLCADNNMKGVRLMSVFGDGRNLFDTAGNLSVDQALFQADVDAFLRIVDGVEKTRGIQFRIIFTLFDFRLADGETIGGLGEHPEVFDPADPRRAQFIGLFRNMFFKFIYAQNGPYKDFPLIKQKRIYWELVNEFYSFKPSLAGRTEDEAMADPLFYAQRNALWDRAESFMMEFRGMIKSVSPLALTAMSDLGAANTIRLWQNRGFDLLDYHSHPDYLDLNGNVGTSLRNVGWNGRQPVIEAEAYIPGWRTLTKDALTERMRASYNRGSRGVLFWQDDYYQFSPSLYKTVTAADLTFQPTADIAVTQITGSTSPVVGDSVAYRAKIRNEGPLSAPGTILKFQVDGAFVDQQNVPPLAPGQVYVSSPVMWTAVQGQHRLLVEADNFLQVSEWDEDNNNVTLKIGVSPYLPDLVVETIGGTAGLNAGQAAVFTVSVANRGVAPAADSVLKLQVDGVEIASHFLPPLAAGEVVVTTTSWSAVNGAHVLLCEADNWLRVTESDEVNNNRSVSFTVPGDGALAPAAGNLPPAADPAFRLNDAYGFPNPVAGEGKCTLRAEVGLAERVIFSVYNSGGEVVHMRELTSPPSAVTRDGAPRYAYDLVWDASGVPSGAYTVVMEAHRDGQNPLGKQFRVMVVR